MVTRHRRSKLGQRLLFQVTKGKNKNLSYKEMESSQVNLVQNHTKEEGNARSRELDFQSLVLSVQQRWQHRWHRLTPNQN